MECEDYDVTRIPPKCIGNKLYDIERILLEVDHLPEFDRQLYLQGLTKDSDPFDASSNEMYHEVDATEQAYTELLFDMPYINSIIKEHNMVRTRLMRVPPRYCYYWHNDHTRRLHVPLETNNGCFMVYENRLVHMPADGNYYIENTTEWHTFVNGGKQARLHLVGAIND